MARDAPGSSGEEGIALQALLERERAQAVREKLVELPPKMRTALTLRFTEGLSIADISEVTGAPAGTVKSDLFRGLQRLHRLLGKEWR